MALPAPPTLGFSFTSFSAGNPTAQQPGGSLDAEFNRGYAATTDLINTVKVSINADGTLNSAQVGAAYTAYIHGGGAGAGTTPDVSVAQSQRYAEVAQGWAEYTFGPLPAETLAVMGITGDHWSAAWWAQQSAYNIAIQDKKLQDALAAGQLNANAPGLPGGPITSLQNMTLVGGVLTALPPSSGTVVTSVAGRHDAVILTASDITDFSAAVASFAPPPPVVSVASHVGAVILHAADIVDFAAGVSLYAPAQVASNTGRNLLQNSRLRVQQRGIGPWSSGYTADRWLGGVNTDASSFSLAPIDDVGRTQIGDEGAAAGLTCAFTGSSAAAALTKIMQRMEGLGRYSNKVLTFSFWARIAAGPSTLKLGISFQQNFGTGGSPSASVFQSPGAVTITPTWQRYSQTFTIPSTAGKVLGTTTGPWVSVEVWFSSGANNNVNAGNIGVQAGTVALWGMQCEESPGASVLERIDDAVDLLNCQRSFCKSFQQAVVPASGAGADTGGAQVIVVTPGATVARSPAIPFPVLMRAPPTITLYNPVNANSQAYDAAAVADASATSALGITDRAFRLIATGAPGTVVGNRLDVHWAATAEL